jgi:hypothetical protein
MRMSTPTVPLFDRLPEIYRTRDAEQSPAYPLRAYLGAIEEAFGALHDDIGRLYDNLFIDTCEDWVVPYLGDLLGTTHLKGEPRTLRADVADTIALRRRKGTLGAIERLAADLTGWACRGVELRENLGWCQHLNHQRPDAGGLPPWSGDRVTRFMVPRGGTAPLRDPATLALLGTPFDPFAYSADVKPAVDDVRHVNLPNLAVFLWRLAAWQWPALRPLVKGASDLGAQPAPLARYAIRLDLHPLDRPVRLFNIGRPAGIDPGASGISGTSGVQGGVVAPLTQADAVPGPMLDARITTGAQSGQPEAYVHIDFFDDGTAPPTGLDVANVGLNLFLPQSAQAAFAATAWRFRGDNLCAWETGLRQPVADGEIVIDPDIGRLLIGVGTEAQRDALVTGTAANLYASFTYASAGPVGASPVVHGPFERSGVALREASTLPDGTSLQVQMDNLDAATQPVVIELQDSGVHTLDIGALAGTAVDGGVSVRLAHSLTVRAADGHRPVVLLARPLGFRPVDAANTTLDTPAVRLEGLHLAPSAGFAAGGALIDRAALARLEIIGCTLDPGGHALRDGTRAPMTPALHLENGYGFTQATDRDAFVPTPDIVVQRSVLGAMAVDDRYRLDLADSIVDAGLGASDAPNGSFAIGAATDPANAWAAPLQFQGLTAFGAVRTSAVGGAGGLFSQRFEVLDDQHGCIRWSWFSGDADRLPPNHFCLHAPQARLAFTAERFGDPGYAQLARGSDARIRTRGPDDDAMGAFGFLLEAHKWTNLQVRLREFMPVGVRPLLVPVT